MKLLFSLLAVLALGTTLPAQNKAALAEISDTYSKIEDSFASWQHFSMAVGNDSGGYVNDLWLEHGDDKLMKLQTLSSEDRTESKLQFFFKGDQLVFTLDRREEAVFEPEATDVIEKRYYFADNKLIRVLEKKGRFPAGKAKDTQPLKNREIDLANIENADETYRDQHEMTAPLIQKLQSLENDAPAAADGAPASGTSGDGWRLIAGSQSRDGAYALGWGIKGQSAAEGDAAEDGSISVSDEAEGLVNYVIDTKTGQILGSLAGKHFGDKITYNHSTTETSWSVGSRFVAQVNSGKWASWDANVYEIKYGEPATVSAPADLLEATKKAVGEHMADSDVFKKFGDDAHAYTLHDVSLSTRMGGSVVVVEVDAQIPKSEEDSYFACTVTFKLEGDENGGAPKLVWSGTERHHE